mgnify:CR=1 FL=1
MAISFSKRELEKKKQGKKLEKQQRKEERKANRGGSSLDDMIAYVDANGMITDTPPDMSSKPKVDAETIAVFVPKKEEQERDAWNISTQTKATVSSRTSTVRRNISSTSATHRPTSPKARW